MAIQKLSIGNFLELAKQFPVLDVRSPGEYVHAHIPNAFSLPLFSDEERKIVGTAYKQQSREKAIKFGLEFFGPKMKNIVEATEKILHDFSILYPELENNKTILVHCWRGGMRSGAIAWLLDMYGFKVYSLEGGYKAFRNWALQLVEQPWQLNVVGGYTGSGKTLVLHELKKRGFSVLDLEALANHKGSAFGALGENPQPSQELFENMLALQLHQLGNLGNPIFVEDESQRIGIVNVPTNFWKQMRNSPLLFLEIPFEERLAYLVENYGQFDKALLEIAINRIQNRLGGLETKMAQLFLKENNFTDCFSILLKYYDKWYLKGLHNRENLKQLVTNIQSNWVDSSICADYIQNQQQNISLQVATKQNLNQAELNK